MLPFSVECPSHVELDLDPFGSDDKRAVLGRRGDDVYDTEGMADARPHPFSVLMAAWYILDHGYCLWGAMDIRRVCCVLAAVLIK